MYFGIGKNPNESSNIVISVIICNILHRLGNPARVKSVFIQTLDMKLGFLLILIVIYKDLPPDMIRVNTGIGPGTSKLVILDIRCKFK